MVLFQELSYKAKNIEENINNNNKKKNQNKERTIDDESNTKIEDGYVLGEDIVVDGRWIENEINTDEPINDEPLVDEPLNDDNQNDEPTSGDQNNEPANDNQNDDNNNHNAATDTANNHKHKRLFMTLFFIIPKYQPQTTQ